MGAVHCELQDLGVEWPNWDVVTIEEVKIDCRYPCPQPKRHGYGKEAQASSHGDQKENKPMKGATHTWVSEVSKQWKRTLLSFWQISRLIDHAEALQASMQRAGGQLFSSSQMNKSEPRCAMSGAMPLQHDVEMWA